MSDPMEEAAAISEVLLAHSLLKRKKVPLKTGYCLECEEPTDGAFCSKECRVDYEIRDKIKQIKGQA